MRWPVMKPAPGEASLEMLLAHVIEVALRLG
jgi:hypothetical protein